MIATALMCLALNVYHESRGENFKGQYAVAQVTMNRADDDPRRVCSVVYEPKQFSWTGKWHPKPKGEAWDNAKTVAGLALNQAFPDYTNGATHFHVKSVHPTWRSKLKRTVVIGSHIFYRTI